MPFSALDLFNSENAAAAQSDKEFSNSLQDSFNDISSSIKNAASINQDVMSSAIHAKQTFMDEWYRTNEIANQSKALDLKAKELDIANVQKQLMMDYRYDALQQKQQLAEESLTRKRQADANKAAFGFLQNRLNGLKMQQGGLIRVMGQDQGEVDRILGKNSTLSPAQQAINLATNDNQASEAQTQLPILQKRIADNRAKFDDINNTIGIIGNNMQALQSGMVDADTVTKSMSTVLAPYKLDSAAYPVNYGTPQTNESAGMPPGMSDAVKASNDPNAPAVVGYQGAGDTSSPWSPSAMANAASGGAGVGALGVSPTPTNPDDTALATPDTGGSGIWGNASSMMRASIDNAVSNFQSSVTNGGDPSTTSNAQPVPGPKFNRDHMDAIIDGLVGGVKSPQQEAQLYPAIKLLINNRADDQTKQDYKNISNSQLVTALKDTIDAFAFDTKDQARHDMQQKQLQQGFYRYGGDFQDWSSYQDQAKDFGRVVSQESDVATKNQKRDAWLQSMSQKLSGTNPVSTVDPQNRQTGPDASGLTVAHDTDGTLKFSGMPYKGDTNFEKDYQVFGRSATDSEKRQIVEDQGFADKAKAIEDKLQSKLWTVKDGHHVFNQEGVGKILYGIDPRFLITDEKESDLPMKYSPGSGGDDPYSDSTVINFTKFRDDKINKLINGNKINDIYEILRKAAWKSDNYNDLLK